jgi:glycosyltransferase involved in cell wall biosynthesis
MKISFVVPAFNEAAWIENCLAHVDRAVSTCQADRATAFATETIVVDNNSSDNTAELAEAAGATVVFEPVNQIARARNAGAAVAEGDWLIFIDADSELAPELLLDVLDLIREGKHAGCGSLMSMTGIPLSMRWMLWLWTSLSKLFDWAAGSFIVCRADIFDEIGGFSDELYASEELDFSRRIKRYASKRGLKFEVLREHPLKTSNRKLRIYSQSELWAQWFRLVLQPRKSLRDKSRLSVWYDGRRE